MTFQFHVTWPGGADIASIDLPFLDVTDEDLARVRKLLIDLYGGDGVTVVEEWRAMRDEP